MGCMMHVGILGQDKKLTEKAKRKFIAEVKDVLKYGTANIPDASKPKFLCGGPLAPDPVSAEALKDLEDKTKFPDFHKNFFEMYEKIANSLDAEGNFSLLPAMADPIALAGKLGATIPSPSFPGGYVPYFAGGLIPKLAADLVKVGKVEFVVLPKLVAALPPPNPPQPPVFEMPPMLGLPPSVTTSAGTQASNSGDVPPVTPLNALSTLTAAHMAMAEGIPKLVANVIAKMPSILTKLPAITEVLADICGLVSESKMFGEIKETSTTQKAATIVLSRKTSECILINAIANTIGSAPGSLTSAIAEISSDNDDGPDVNRYEAISPQPITVSDNKPTPIDRAMQRADALNNTSYGDQNKNSSYISGLYYIEDLLSRSGITTINGAQPSTNDALPGNLKTFAGTPLEFQNRYAVENQPGFLEYAKDAAKVQSSCGLFIRACYSAGGATNEFFLSMYPVSNAMRGLIRIGHLRNYRWITDKENNEGIIDAINTGFFYLNADGKGTTKPIDNNTSKITITMQEIMDVAPGNFDLIVENKVVVPIQDKNSNVGKLLRAFLKPHDKRALIGELELRSILKKEHPDYGSFPALKRGDAVFVADEKSEHIFLVNAPRAEGFTIKVTNGVSDKNGKAVTILDGDAGYLDPPIEGISGGQPDASNKTSVEELIKKFAANKSYVSYEVATPALQAAFDVNKANPSYPYSEGQLAYTKEGVAKQLNLTSKIKPEFLWVEVKSDIVGRGEGTAIRSSTTDRGRFTNAAFFLGQEFYITDIANQKIADKTTRQVKAIFKGENFLDADENGEIVGQMTDARKEYITTAAFDASVAMDLTKGLSEIASNVNIDALENRVFFENTLKLRKDTAAAAVLKEKNKKP